MARSRGRVRLPEGEFEAEINDIGQDGRGLACVDGKAALLYGGLPGEFVKFRYLGRRRGHDEGQVVSVIRASDDRAEPVCPHFGVCGGCSMQHLQPSAQVRFKQEMLMNQLQQLGQVRPESILPPITNHSPWGYRRKARLGVKDVVRKGRVLVGFRERGSSFVADLQKCHVLHPHVGELLPELSGLIASLSISGRLPQIEMAMDDARCVLILRILDPISAEDRRLLEQFQADHDLVFYLQPGGPETVSPLGHAVDLCYSLPAYDLQLGFLPSDFTQVNTEINRKMVARALDLLDLQPADRVLDLFCGIGNFTLPIARSCREATGVEGDVGLVVRARANAQRNRIDNAQFFSADLYAELEAEPWLDRTFDKALLDPPRSGAQQILPLLPGLGVKRIVYVSCYPGTLARDAGQLVNQHGYRLISAGVMDMFPHTAHVESIAFFEKD
jgi:23S rRNA (uracil1939-C5)-methyltransferase